MADVDDLIVRVQTRVTAVTGDPLTDDPLVQSDLNEALHDIEVEQPDGWPWLEVVTTFETSAGVEAEAVPVDWAKTANLSLLNDDGSYEEPMLPLESSELRILYPTLSQSRPEAWSIEANQILLRPVPDATRTIVHSYIRTETDLDAGGSGEELTPLLPSRFYGPLVTLAAAKVLRDMQNHSAADQLENQYAVGLRRMFAAATSLMAGPARTRYGRYLSGS